MDSANCGHRTVVAVAAPGLPLGGHGARGIAHGEDHVDVRAEDVEQPLAAVAVEEAQELPGQERGAPSYSWTALEQPTRHPRLPTGATGLVRAPARMLRRPAPWSRGTWKPCSAEQRPMVGQQLLEEGRAGLHRTDVQHDPRRLRSRNVTHSAPAEASRRFTVSHRSADTLIHVQYRPTSKEHAHVSEAATATSPRHLAVDDGFRVVQRLVLPADQELDVQSLYVSGVTSISSRQRLDVPPVRRRLRERRGRGRERRRDQQRRGQRRHVRLRPDHRRRRRGGRPAASGDARHLLQRLPGQLLAAVDRVLRRSGSTPGCAATARSSSTGRPPRATCVRADSVPVDNDETADGRRSTCRSSRSSTAAGTGSTSRAATASWSLEDGQWGFETDRRPQRAGSPSASRRSTGPTSASPSCVNLAEQRRGARHPRRDRRRRPGHPEGRRRPRTTQRPRPTLGGKLRVIEQPNLGGSGGFSRVDERGRRRRGASDYVLLLDDDVVCELEGILRAVAFADLAKTPTLVGGQMFSLYDRSVMHAYGETIAKYRWFWGPAPPTVHGHDFATQVAAVDVRGCTAASTSTTTAGGCA